VKQRRTLVARGRTAWALAPAASVIAASTVATGSRSAGRVWPAC